MQVRDLAARWREAGSNSDSPSLCLPVFSESKGSASPSLYLWHTSCCLLPAAPGLGTKLLAQLGDRG